MTNSAVSRKSAEAFRTISEVAETLKLPQHVLRFWETRFAQVKPLKRAGGRRFYRPEDIELLGAIRQLLYGEGYTIKGVQRMLREQGPRGVVALAQRRDGPPTEVQDSGDEALPESDAPGGDDADAVPTARHDAEIADLLEAALNELADCRRILSGVTAT